MALENYYEGFLNTHLKDEESMENDVKSRPSLSEIRASLQVQTTVLRGWKPSLECSEDDTSDYHKALLVPLCMLARVCMADVGSTLGRKSAKDLDEDLQHLHPTAVSRKHREGSGFTKPDHTIIGGEEEPLMSMEDKNTSFGVSKWETLEQRVGTGSVDGILDEDKVWRQVSLMM